MESNKELPKVRKRALYKAGRWRSYSSHLKRIDVNVLVLLCVCMYVCMYVCAFFVCCAAAVKGAATVSRDTDETIVGEVHQRITLLSL